MPYFDHNATTPLCPPAREAWLRVQDRLWHNASGLYREAAAANDALEDARERLADCLGLDAPERLVFTSGATEANNAVLRSWTGRRVAISPWEHPSVREPATRLLKATTAADPARLTEHHAVAWMAANNETGEIFALNAVRAPLFHCDAAQWIGKLPAGGLPFDRATVTGCAHKFGGPKGVGFLVLPAAAEENFTVQAGGPQESRRRAGTQDVAGAVAMAAALEWALDHGPGDPAPRDAFEHALGWPVVGGGRPRLWNTSMVVAPRHDNRLWVGRLSRHGVQCSTGSACSTGKDGDSHTLAAMGLTPDEMKRVLRFSSGWETAPQDWETLLATLRTVAAELDAR